MTTEYTEITATGVRSRGQALIIAQGFADLHRESYIVMAYQGPPPEYDVCPALPTDRPTVTPHVIELVHPIQESGGPN